MRAPCPEAIFGRSNELGKHIERADQTTRVLDIGYISLSSGDDDALVSVQWNTLVRALAGYHLYRSKFPAGQYARDVATFLLFEPEFARSVASCTGRNFRRVGHFGKAATDGPDRYDRYKRNLP